MFAASAGEEERKRGREEGKRKEEEEEEKEEEDAGLAVRRSMLKKMKSLTLADDDTCHDFLQKSEYNLEAAVQMFYAES